jgi:dTDP-4-dehydrorhamnose reductase
MLGSTFRSLQIFEKQGKTVIYADRDLFDVADMGQCDIFLQKNPIDTIINCAAYTNVEQAEDQ